MDEEKIIKLKDYACRLLSFRPRSCHEIRSKLMQFSIKRGISSKLVDKVVNDLVEKRIINDEEFAIWWIDQRRRVNPRGERAIKIELFKKGIERKLVEKLLSGSSSSKKEEVDSALEIVNKKIAKYMKLPKRKLKAKIAMMLSSRGFSWQTIYQVVDLVVERT